MMTLFFADDLFTNIFMSFFFFTIPEIFLHKEKEGGLIIYCGELTSGT